MNAIKVLEKERKYLLEKLNKGRIWEKEMIVYQWYTSGGENESTKLKIVFDMSKSNIVCVKVKKERASTDSWNKEVEYLELANIDLDKMIGKRFVLKRRAIDGDVFLDKFIRSNNLCEYLVEVENEADLKHVEELGIIVGRDVTEDSSYYNVNMCGIFSENDLEKLKFLLSIFEFK